MLGSNPAHLVGVVRERGVIDDKVLRLISLPEFTLNERVGRVNSEFSTKPPRHDDEGRQGSRDKDIFPLHHHAKQNEPFLPRLVITLCVCQYEPGHPD